MEVAVAGVEDVADAQPVLALELRDPLEHLGQLRAGYDAVLDVVVVADPAHRGERRLAPLPEERALGVVGRDPDLDRPALAADPLDARRDRPRPGRRCRRARRSGPLPQSGYPGWTAASAASSVSRSMISIAPARMPAAITPETAAPASLGESKPASSVRTVSGRRRMRSVMRVAMPSVPSEPISDAHQVEPVVVEPLAAEVHDARRRGARPRGPSRA